MTLSLIGEWRRYRKNWAALRVKYAGLTMAQFWSVPEIKTTYRYPTLSTLGRWYAQMPTASPLSASLP